MAANNLFFCHRIANVFIPLHTSKEYTYMTKKIFASILLAGIMAVSVPTMAMAAASIEIIEQENQKISISVSGSVLRVTGADGEALHVYNITGVRVMSIKVDGYDKSYTLNLPKGCYIVKVGKTVRKISIR